MNYLIPCPVHRTKMIKKSKKNSFLLERKIFFLVFLLLFYLVILLLRIEGCAQLQHAYLCNVFIKNGIESSLMVVLKEQNRNSPLPSSYQCTFVLLGSFQTLNSPFHPEHTTSRQDNPGVRLLPPSSTSEVPLHQPTSSCPFLPPFSPSQ